MSSRAAPESALVEAILGHLRTADDHEDLAVEVRSHGRAATDIVVIRNDEVVGIEAKVSDWKSAVAQAYLNRHCVDRSYVAFWSDRITPALMDAAGTYEIGVYAVSAEGLQAVLDAPLAAPNSLLRSKMIDKLRRREEMTAK